ncbi:hypothetical protein AVEN_131080-1 [Araneus ventricosus]|uniref:Uncharacterized protein n=1 Tax=Araneus ventricosus TaxID=182803 RepID=A0A4Y2D303_ARAVE|nr:hypothetical protein AVEN_131080-1 [Araneus ventricosus]
MKIHHSNAGHLYGNFMVNSLGDRNNGDKNLRQNAPDSFPTESINCCIRHVQCQQQSRTLFTFSPSPVKRDGQFWRPPSDYRQIQRV